ncbi:MAG: UDP-N-acetylmuramate--L-alanine ligase [Clostridia bacterium]|nr:UDP-N-acetylmuramate--L-alanine ligase [Clostridia bacterium]
MKNFEKYFGKDIYFLGIGGVSLSAMAKLCNSIGVSVSGSDVVENEYTISLKNMGVDVFIGHSKDNITKSISTLVYSSAVGLDNIELVTAKSLGIKCVERGEFLSKLCSLFDSTIAISGTHGKTTTTALIHHILSFSGLHPSMHLGGTSVNYKSNAVFGGESVFVTEACEYKNSFSCIHSKIAVVTNIEKEHMDYYSNMDEVFMAYNNFVSHTECLVTWESELTCKLKCKKTFVCGFSESCDFIVRDVIKLKSGYGFQVLHQGKILGNFQINHIGMHNVYNAVLAIATVYLLSIDVPHIYVGLITFLGVGRRYENIGSLFDTPVISDYAHHPTEIKSSIDGIKTHYKNILCIFQPHTFSRTKTLINEFKTCFLGVKHLIIYKTYNAREKSIVGGRAKDLYAVVKNASKEYVPSKKQLVNTLSNIDFGAYDVVLVLGAGDIDKIVRNKILKDTKLFC